LKQAQCRISTSEQAATRLGTAQERDAILGLHASIFSEATGDLRALRLAAAPADTLWAASMVNSRCFADEVGFGGVRA
jgi:hypothetical protein